MPEEPVEPLEVHEQVMGLREAGEPKENSAISVSFAITILTVLSTLLAVFAHRSQEEVSLLDTRATEEWQYYQSRRDRALQAEMKSDLVQIFQRIAGRTTPGNQPEVEKWIDAQRKAAEKQRENMKAVEEQARELEEQSHRAGGKASRISTGQTIIQIGVLLCSMTLYARRRVYLFIGLGFAVLGMVVAVWGIFI